MADNSWCEISRRCVTINKYEEIYAIWHDSYLTVHADRSLRILEFSLNLRSIDKKIDCIEYAIKAPRSTPASELLNFPKRQITGIDLAKMTMDPALWPHSDNIVQEMCDITAFEWSPGCLLWNNDYILAVLNNIGHVEFYRKKRKIWVVALDLSALLCEQFQETSDQDETKRKRPSDLETMAKTVYSLETTAICWARNINSDNSAFFLTAQKNGAILIWSVREENFTIKAECINKINTEFNEITKLMWVCTGSKVFIPCSNSEGQLFILEYYVSNNKNITQHKNHVLWNHKDRMVIQHCSYVTLENKMIFICVKHRFLIIQLLSSECDVLCQITKNLNDYKISDIWRHQNLFYVTTANGSVFQINYKLVENTLDIQYNKVNIKDYSPSCELLSGGFSKNGVLLTLGVIDRKILHRKHEMKFEIIYYDLPDSDFPEFSLLLNNSSKKLTNFLDCIEKLRYKIVKSRRIPKYDYNNLLLEGEKDVYKLKIFFIVRLICNVLEENFKIAKGSLPEISLEHIREKIAVAHAKAMLINIYEKFKINQSSLTKFETETFVGCRNYLEIICKKNNSDLDISNDILYSINNECNYTCQCCDKIMNEFSCEDGHLNAFCSVTFTPIESDDYLICKCCGVTASSELSNDKPMCVYCDLYFEYS